MFLYILVISITVHGDLMCSIFTLFLNSLNLLSFVLISTICIKFSLRSWKV